MRGEGLEESAVLRKLLNMAISEWKKEKALKLLAERKISYMKAVEKLGFRMVKEKKIIWAKDEIISDLNARMRPH